MCLKSWVKIMTDVETQVRINLQYSIQYTAFNAIMQLSFFKFSSFFQNRLSYHFHSDLLEREIVMQITLLKNLILLQKYLKPGV